MAIRSIKRCDHLTPESPRLQAILSPRLSVTVQNTSVIHLNTSATVLKTSVTDRNASVTRLHTSVSFQNTSVTPLHRSVSSQNMSVTALRIPVNALTHVGNGSADKSEGNLTQAPRRSTRTDREQNAFTTAFFETLLHKPAREQGRNSQLECIALAYARACAFALRVSPWYLPIADGLRCFVVEFYSI